MRFRKSSRFQTALSVMAIALGMAILLIGSVSAQQSAPADTLQGRVVFGAQPQSGIPVTLHRVTPDASGEIATTSTGADGTFAFPLEPVQGARFNVFFVTAEYLSVRYFGDPVHLDQPRGAYTLAVFDTTSTLPEPVRVNRRDLVMLPQENDSWEVNEIISILNTGDRALVSASGLPTLEIPIPERAADFQAGEGDILPHEVSFMENRILLLTPVIPGRRDLFVRYRIPAQPASAAVPVEQPTDTFNLYVQQPSHLSSVEGLATAQMISVEGEQFLQYGGMDLPSGARISLQWRGGPPVDPVTAAVGVTLALLAAGAWVATRNRPSANVD